MTAKKDQPAKRGPKPKPADEKGSPLTLRMTDSSRKELGRYAELMGMSLSAAAVSLVHAGIAATVTPEQWAALDSLIELRAKNRAVRS